MSTRHTWIVLGLLIAWAVLVSACTETASSGGTPTPAPSREDVIPAEAVKMTAATDLTPPILHVSGWQQPVSLAGPVNTAGAEDSAFVSPDGDTLYFFFTPDVSVPPEKQLLDGVTGVYVSHRVDGQWGEVTRVILQEPGKLALDGCEFVQDGVMWFCSAREGYAGVNLFTAEWADGRWQNWRHVGATLGDIYQVGEMHLTADGQRLFFHSPREGGQGKLDIWVSQRLGEVWQPPENVTAVNTAEDDGWPFITQDGSELWFTRTYRGTPAIFRSRNVDGRWGAPEPILSQFAGEPSLDEAGNIYFTHHFYRDGQMIEADIYVAYRQ